MDSVLLMLHNLNIFHNIIQKGIIEFLEGERIMYAPLDDSWHQERQIPGKSQHFR